MKSKFSKAHMPGAAPQPKSAKTTMATPAHVKAVQKKANSGHSAAC